MAVRIPRGQLVFSEEDCSPFDIGLVLNRVKTLSDAKKLNFIENVWSLCDDRLFEYPCTVESGKKRKFQRSWLEQYAWLAS